MDNFDQIWQETVGSLPQIDEKDATISNGLNPEYAKKVAEAHDLTDDELFQLSEKGEI